MRESVKIFFGLLVLSIFLSVSMPGGALAAERLVAKPWIGITVKDAASPGGDYAQGVLVEDVIKGGPAEEAGLEPEDVILGVNGSDVYGVADFVTEIRRMSAGAPVALKVDRDGEIKTVEIVLAQRPAGLFSRGAGAYYTGYPGAQGCARGAEACPDEACPHAAGMPGRGSGVSGGAKYGKMYFARLFHTLGLAPEQRKKAAALESEYMKRSIRDRADVKVAEVELDELASAEKIDLQKVKAKIDEIAAKEAGLRFFRFRTMEDFKKLLTPEQAEKMRKMRMMDGMPGHGGFEGMGHEVYGAKSCGKKKDGGAGYGGAFEEPVQPR